MRTGRAAALASTLNSVSSSTYAAALAAVTAAAQHRRIAAAASAGADKLIRLEARREARSAVKSILLSCSGRSRAAALTSAPRSRPVKGHGATSAAGKRPSSSSRVSFSRGGRRSTKGAFVVSSPLVAALRQGASVLAGRPLAAAPAAGGSQSLPPGPSAASSPRVMPRAGGPVALLPESLALDAAAAAAVADEGPQRRGASSPASRALSASGQRGTGSGRRLIVQPSIAGVRDRSRERSGGRAGSL